MPHFGLDVSHFQPVMDWDEVRREGFDFAFVKATQGTGFVDPHYSANVSRLGDTKLIYGGYHFLEHGQAGDQVNHFLAVVGDPDGQGTMLDVEGSGATIDDVRAWIAAYKRRTHNHAVLLYLPHWYWQQIGRPNLADSGADALWASHYVSGSGFASTLYEKVPGSYWDGYGGLEPAILQFTSSGRVAGVTVDCDAYRGDLADLAALTTGHADPGNDPGRDSSRYRPENGDGLLELWERGGDIAHVQKLLGVDDDGFFGPVTRAAVVRVQAIYSPPLAVDGIYGPQTAGVVEHHHLDVDGAFGPRTCAAMQIELNRHGGELTVDGVFGPKTKRQLQRYLHVEVDGVIGPVTVRALQEHVGAHVDGDWGPKTTSALQTALNAGRF